MPPGIRVAVGHDDEVPQARPDHVVASGTPVRLVASDLADLEPRNDGPGRRFCS
jgi:hypothetical protein